MVYEYGFIRYIGTDSPLYYRSSPTDPGARGYYEVQRVGSRLLHITALAGGDVCGTQRVTDQSAHFCRTSPVLIEMEILPYFIIVPSSIENYRQAMVDIARVGRSGGAIYDALILQAARSINASRLYTFNDKHFRPLLHEDESLEIVCP